MLSRVSCWPLPGTSLRKPAWLTGVGPDTPLAGEGGVIWDTKRAFLFEADASPAPTALAPLKAGGLATTGAADVPAELVEAVLAVAVTHVHHHHHAVLL